MHTGAKCRAELFALLHCPRLLHRSGEVLQINTRQVNVLHRMKNHECLSFRARCFQQVNRFLAQRLARAVPEVRHADRTTAKPAKLGWSGNVGTRLNAFVRGQIPSAIGQLFRLVPPLQPTMQGVVNQEVVDRTIKRCHDKGIILPTLAQQ